MLLFLFGCSSTPIDELYDQAVACEVECDELWASYEDRKNSRRAEPKCPKGYVYWKGHWDEGCVTQRQAEVALRSMGF